MADENTPDNTVPATNELFIPRATFGRDEFQEVVDVLRTEGDPVPGFARMLTKVCFHTNDSHDDLSWHSELLFCFG